MSQEPIVAIIGYDGNIMTLSINRDFRPIHLADKPIFDSYLRVDPPKASEYTFTNFFMWRRKYNTRWAISDDCILMIVQVSGGKLMGLQPFGSGDKRKAFMTLCGVFESEGLRPVVGRVTDDFLEDCVDFSLFDLVEDPDNADYVYQAEKLINLSGNKYHRKKNHLNRFIKNFDFEYQGFSLGLIDNVLSLQETWCEFKDCYEDDNLFHEDTAVCDALQNFEVLGFRGGAILIDGQVQAFSFGEMLNPETAVIHIEKANPEIDGLYTAINQRFCASTWAHVRFVNREQDMGLEGLRKAKQSYYPHHMVNKWIVQVR